MSPQTLGMKFRWCWLCRGWREFVRMEGTTIICRECLVIALEEGEETIADIAADAMRALARDVLT